VNCTASIVQGIGYHADAQSNKPVPELMKVDLTRYHTGNIEVTCTVDVAKGKVRRDVAKAIHALPKKYDLLRGCG
jgi:myo-inositol-1-phosphate synthase